MGKLKNGILGITVGKVGNVVGSKWKNINTVRIYQPQIYNPRTVSQTAQRSKFSTTVAFVRQVLPLINEIYAGSLTKMSPFNKVTSLIVKNAFVGEPPVLDQTLVKLGDIEGSEVLNVVNTGVPDQIMKITWEPNSIIQAELDSKLSFVLINCVTNKAMIFSEVAARSEGSTQITAPRSWADCDSALHVITTDYSNPVKPKKVVKFCPGNELSGHIK
ncbi:MAG: DUF6266 family protein [Bacteroidota bacterium]